jgi:hypothetical protein
MKKILTGLLGIVSVVAVTSVSAYALFIGQATVTGFNLQAGTAALTISQGDSTPTSNVNLAGTTIKLVPGEVGSAVFTLHNEGDVNMTLKGRLTSAEGDWGALNSLIEARIYTGDTPSGTWRTLAEWNAEDGITISGGDLAEGGERDYTVQYRLVSTADNTVAGKMISNITFVFTGTQH